MVLREVTRLPSQLRQRHIECLGSDSVDGSEQPEVPRGVVVIELVTPRATGPVFTEQQRQTNATSMKSTYE
jgi:hypothetical protein